MSRFRRLPRAAAALAMIPLAGLAVACGSSDSDSAAGNSSADFTLKVFDPGNSGAIAVGKRDGTYDEALAPLGAKIEWVKTTPGFSSNLKLFNSGELDIQTGAYSPVVGALSKDVGVRIFATSDPYNKDQAGIIATPESRHQDRRRSGRQAYCRQPCRQGRVHHAQGPDAGRSADRFRRTCSAATG